MKPLLFSLVILFISKIGMTQDVSSFSRKLQYGITAGVGYSYVHYTNKSINEKFPAPEFRIGLSLQKSLSESLSIQSGLRIGIRLRTAKVYNSDNYANATYRSIGSIDETFSKEDHYFFEIPLGLRYEYRKLGIGTGVVYRNLVQFDDTKYQNFMSTADVGITPSITYRLTNKIRAGAEYYFGTIRFFEGFTRDNIGNDFYTKARNRFGQLFITYSF